MIKDWLDEADDEHPPLDQQEYFILGPYIDLLEADDGDSFVALAEHAGIELDGDDPLRSILQHYWIGAGFYDLDQAMHDLSSFPSVAARLAVWGMPVDARKLN